MPCGNHTGTKVLLNYTNMFTNRLPNSIINGMDTDRYCAFVGSFVTVGDCDLAGLASYLELYKI